MGNKQKHRRKSCRKTKLCCMSTNPMRDGRTTKYCVDIVYEDDDLIVEQSARMVVHPAAETDKIHWSMRFCIIASLSGIGGNVTELCTAG